MKKPMRTISPNFFGLNLMDILLQTENCQHPQDGCTESGQAPVQHWTHWNERGVVSHLTRAHDHPLLTRRARDYTLPFELSTLGASRAHTCACPPPAPLLAPPSHPHKPPLCATT